MTFCFDFASFAFCICCVIQVKNVAPWKSKDHMLFASNGRVHVEFAKHGSGELSQTFSVLPPLIWRDSLSKKFKFVVLLIFSIREIMALEIEKKIWRYFSFFSSIDIFEIAQLPALKWCISKEILWIKWDFFWSWKLKVETVHYYFDPHLVWI